MKFSEYFVIFSPIVSFGKKDKNPLIHISVIYNNSVSLFIKDNAGGIPEEIMHKIFESYFMTKSAGKGTGLVLYVSKLIIEENMKGELFIRNVKEGAQFEIRISLK